MRHVMWWTITVLQVLARAARNKEVNGELKISTGSHVHKHQHFSSHFFIVQLGTDNGMCQFLFATTGIGFEGLWEFCPNVRPLNGPFHTCKYFLDVVVFKWQGCMQESAFHEAYLRSRSMLYFSAVWNTDRPGGDTDFLVKHDIPCGVCSLSGNQINSVVH